MEIENSIPLSWRESTISILKRQNKFLHGNVFLSEPLSTPRDSSHCKKLCKSVSGFRHKSSLTEKSFPSSVRQYHKHSSRDIAAYFPQTSSATSFTSRSLFHCSSSVSLFPISQDANPHCGLRHSLSRGTNLDAS